MLRDERGEEVNERVFHYEGGLREFVKYLNKNKEVLFPEPVYIEGEKNGVIVENETGARSLVECDTVVMCVGMKPKAEEAESLHNLACYSRIVGDAKKAARMNEAVTDGYFAGYYVQEAEG